MTLEQDLTEAHFRLCSTTIENLPWQKVIEKYDRPYTLFYCDPPYWQTEGYGFDFGWHQYQQLYDLAKSIKGQMIISINGHPEIRELFRDLPVVEVDYQYTVGGADGRSDCIELIYGTWPGGVPKPKGQTSLFG